MTQLFSNVATPASDLGQLMAEFNRYKVVIAPVSQS